MLNFPEKDFKTAAEVKLVLGYMVEHLVCMVAKEENRNEIKALKGVHFEPMRR